MVGLKPGPSQSPARISSAWPITTWLLLEKSVQWLTTQMSHLYKKTIKEKSFEKVNDPSNVKIRKHVVKNDNTVMWIRWVNVWEKLEWGRRALFFTFLLNKSYLYIIYYCYLEMLFQFLNLVSTQLNVGSWEGSCSLFPSYSWQSQF